MLDTSQLQERLTFAVGVALEAGLFTLEYFQSDSLAVETKSNATPVTEADKGAEQRLRDAIGKAYPNDGILGEEFGEKSGTSGYRWILDPIDGTKSFVRGVPLYGTMVGLEANKEAALGVVFFPALGEMMYGATGCGAFWVPRGLNDGSADPIKLAVPARVSKVKTLADGLFTTTSVSTYAKVSRQSLYEALQSKAGLSRGWGDCYGHMLVATGRAEIMVDPMMNPWDCAALKPIVEEAGGTFTDLASNATIYGGNALSTNGHVFDETMGVIKKTASYRCDV